MRYIAAFLGLLWVMSAEASVGSSSESKLCTETAECFLYKSVCKAEGYEVRQYTSAQWVSTEETAWSMDKAAFMAFWRLFKYINGANKEGKKIKMTAPVIIKVSKKTGLFSDSSYTMSFLLPSAHQLHPPEPADSQVKVSRLPNMHVYVRGYGGWMMSVSDWINTRRLSESLDSVGASYFGDYHYAVRYDSLMKMSNRHNEVWFVVKGEPVCPAALKAP